MHRSFVAPSRFTPFLSFAPPRLSPSSPRITPFIAPAHAPATARTSRPFSHTNPVKMGKSDSDVVQEFNEYVNMTVPELEKWLKSADSQESGWGEGEESVGHESGRKIVDILKRNPKKQEDKYTEEDLQHMRKVAAYCKRHLARESCYPPHSLPFPSGRPRGR